MEDFQKVRSSAQKENKKGSNKHILTAFKKPVLKISEKKVTEYSSQISKKKLSNERIL